MSGDSSSCPTLEPDRCKGECSCKGVERPFYQRGRRPLVWPVLSEANTSDKEQRCREIPGEREQGTSQATTGPSGRWPCSHRPAPAVPEALPGTGQALRGSARAWAKNTSLASNLITLSIFQAFNSRGVGRSLRVTFRQKIKGKFPFRFGLLFKGWLEISVTQGMYKSP